MACAPSQPSRLAAALSNSSLDKPNRAGRGVGLLELRSSAHNDGAASLGRASDSQPIEQTPRQRDATAVLASWVLTQAQHLPPLAGHYHWPACPPPAVLGWLVPVGVEWPKSSSSAARCRALGRPSLDRRGGSGAPSMARTGRESCERLSPAAWLVDCGQCANEDPVPRSRVIPERLVHNKRALAMQKAAQTHTDTHTHTSSALRASCS